MSDDKSKEKYYTVISPALTMRKEADGRSEVVSEALFSEAVDVLEEKGDWAHIRTLVDGYSGWVKREGVCACERPYAVGIENDTVKVTVNRLAAHVYDRADTVYGPILTVPFESRFEVVDYKDDGARWLEVVLPDLRRAYIQRGNVFVDAEGVGDRMGIEQLFAFSFAFIGLPYTWGGRSSFGYDCSGFVQMLYRLAGVYLPRDSKDQFVYEGFKDRAIEELEAGDLIFWGYSEDWICHVGMSLGEGNFIHTSAVTENKPFLRVSSVRDAAWNGTGYYPFLAGKSLIR